MALAAVGERRIELQTSLHQFCKANEHLRDRRRDGRQPLGHSLQCVPRMPDGRHPGHRPDGVPRTRDRQGARRSCPSELDHLRAAASRATPSQARLERVFDVVASLVLLLAVSWPVMLRDGAGDQAGRRPLRLACSIARCASASTASRSSCMKFRSMRDRCGRRWQGRAGRAANDNRVTRVGRIIRKLRIDELPQILNVLAGADEPRRPAAGAAGVRLAARSRDPVLCRAAHDQAGRHRLGAAVLPVRRR